jgi:YfiH family protein
MKLNKSLNPNIYYCFGNRTDSLSLLRSGQISLFIDSIEINRDSLVMADQTHSAEIRLIDKADKGAGFCENKPEIPVVDGFITDMPRVFIVIKGADCTPILVYAKNKNIVGGCHSGREGTKKGIIKELIRKFIIDFGVLVEDLVIMIGPAISGINYQVSEEIFNDFVSTTGLEQDFRHIDMQKVIIRDILEMGVKMNQIVNNSICTFSDQDYFSYRRNKAKDRQLSIIGIRDEKIY